MCSSVPNKCVLQYDTFEWFMSHADQDVGCWRIYSSLWIFPIYTYVFNFILMSHMGMSHITHMNQSCHMYECVMSHTDQNVGCLYISARTHTHARTHTNKRIYMLHIWMRRVTHMDESCHTYRWVISHVWMSHVTHTNESWHTQIKIVACRSTLGARTHTHTHTHTHMQASYMNESCHTYEWGCHAHEWGCHTYEWAMSHTCFTHEYIITWMSHVIHMNASCHTYEYVMT